MLRLFDASTKIGRWPAVTKGIQFVRCCHSNGLFVLVIWLTPTKSATEGRTDFSGKCTCS